MSPQDVSISDSYSGDLSESPSPQRRTLSTASIVKMSVGPMDNNVYIITCAATGKQLVIDAANDAERILAVVEELPGTPELIFTTHQHPDHWQALEAVTSGLGVPTATGRLDADPLPVRPDRLIDDGDRIQVGELTFDAIHLVGHTPGSIALALRDGDVVHLFTGDCLFPGGIGKTWQPGDFDTLLADVTTKVFDRFGDSTVVYPGHGTDTTLGAERPALAEWRVRGW